MLGNHDEINVGKLATDVRILDGEIARPSSFTIGGVCGNIGNPGKNQRKTDEEFLAALQFATGSQIDVFLMHQGPQGANADPPVFDPVHEYLQTRKELLVLFGHKPWEELFYISGHNLYCNVHERIVVFLPESCEHCR